MAPDRVRRHTVVLDANAFFLPFQFGINIDVELTRLIGEYRFVVPSTVAHELKRLKEAGVPYTREAFSLFQHLDPEVIETPGPADRDLVNVALELQGYLFSLDTEVRRSARKVGVPVILMRGKKYLELQSAEH